MIANKKFKSSETLWWAHSKAHGWVVLDKTLTRNRCSFHPEEYTFIRCRDWSAYEQGHQPWNYTEAGRYLERPQAGNWKSCRVSLRRGGKRGKALGVSRQELGIWR